MSRKNGHEKLKILAPWSLLMIYNRIKRKFTLWKAMLMDGCS
jgi:hypothetical protein